MKGLTRQTAGSDKATILKTAPNVTMIPKKNPPQEENERDNLPMTSAGCSATNRDTSMHIDTPDAPVDSRPDSALTTQPDGGATPMQQSGKEATPMLTACEISQTLIRQLFIQDNEKEARDAVFLCIEYEHQIYSYLHKLEVSMTAMCNVHAWRLWRG